MAFIKQLPYKTLTKDDSPCYLALKRELLFSIKAGTAI
jgi:hypothetical protein